MYALLLGLVLLGLKLAGIEPVTHWAWWWVLSPLGVAVVWWAWADYTGLTEARSMRRQQKREHKRMNIIRKALKLPPKEFSPRR